MDIPAYDSLADFYQSMGLSLRQNLDVSVQSFWDIHPDTPVISPIFRANYYSIVIIEQGKGLYKLDDQRFEIKNNTVYFTNPGHVKGFEIHERTKGYLISFSDEFLRQQCSPERYLDLSFILSERSPPWYAPENKMPKLVTLANMLLSEYSDQDTIDEAIIGALLIALLSKIKRNCWQDYDPLKEGETQSSIVSTFKRNLNQHFLDLLAGKVSAHIQVQTLAAQQYLNANYFSTVIKNKTGKTVNQWIAEKTIIESKAMLKNSRESVQTIAYQLGFAEPTQFSKFFKKHTGKTPTQFRLV